MKVCKFMPGTERIRDLRILGTTLVNRLRFSAGLGIALAGAFILVLEGGRVGVLPA